MKNKFNFKKTYEKNLDFVKSCKSFILLILIVFFAFALLGFFLKPTPEIEQQLMEVLKQILEKTQGMSALELINFIFWNNLQSSFLGFFFGILFGIFPFLIAISNGYLLGFVASKSVALEGILSLWKVFPHGLFELPAVFISLGIGMKLGSFIFQKNKLEFVKTCFSNAIEAFLFIIIPLLIIAAIIEGLLVAFV